MHRKFTRGVFLILAPLVYMSGQFLLSRWQAQGPDWIWSASHALLLIGVVLFVPSMTALKQYLGDHTSSALPDAGTGFGTSDPMNVSKSGLERETNR